MCDRDLRHSLLKMSFISGERSDRTFRHSEMRSTSSSVIGFLGREDLPRCSTVTMMSMASATKDWNRQQTLEEQPNNRLIFTQAKGYSHFAFSYLEQYQCNARPLCSVWWPNTLPRKNLHPSGSLWAEVWIKRSGDYWVWTIHKSRKMHQETVSTCLLPSSRAWRSWEHSVSRKCPFLSPASELELRSLHPLVSPLPSLSLFHFPQLESVQMGHIHFFA